MKNKLRKIVIPIMIFISLLIGMAFFQYIPLILFKINLDTMSQSMKVLYSLSCDIGFMIIMFFIYRKVLIDDFKKTIKNFGKNIELAFKYYFLGLVIMIVTNLLIRLFFTGASANNENAVRSLIDLYPIYMLFSVSLYAPFIEELIFRKSIRDAVISYKNNKFTKYLYIFISGLIFGSMHVIGSVTNSLDYLYIIPYFALGSVFAALYYKSDNIFLSMIMHSMHNTAAILLLLLAGV